MNNNMWDVLKYGNSEAPYFLCINKYLNPYIKKKKINNIIINKFAIKFN